MVVNINSIVSCLPLGIQEPNCLFRSSSFQFEKPNEAVLVSTWVSSGREKGIFKPQLELQESFPIFENISTIGLFMPEHLAQEGTMSVGSRHCTMAGEVQCGDKTCM